MTADQSRLSRSLARVGRFSARNPRTVLAGTLVLLLVAGGVALATVQLNMGMMLYIDEDSETAAEWETLESTYDRGNTVFVVVETADVRDPETVRFIERLDRRYTELDRIERVQSLADVVRAGAGGSVPDTERGVTRAISAVEERSNASAALVETVSPKSGMSVLVLTYGDVAPPADDGGLLDVVATKDADVIERQVTGRTDEVTVPQGTSVTVTGASIFEHAAFELMLFDVLTLFAGGFVLVLGVVYVVMRRRLETNWHAFLPLATALVALVVMLAAMGVLGYDFNAIMLSVLPVGLGLGVDYGLQIQTRYAEEREGGETPADAAGVAVSTTGRTLLLAMGTTIVGFGSLFVSAVPPVRQFGVTASISVLASMALSVTFLVALLVRFDDRAGTTAGAAVASDEGGGREEAASGGLEAAVTTVAGVASARPLVLLIVVLPVVAGGALAYPHVDTTQQMLDYWPRDIEEREEFESVTETLPSPKTIYVVVESDDAYSPRTFRDVAAFQDRISRYQAVNAVGGPVSTVRTATGGRIPDSSAAIRATVERGAESPLAAVQRPSENPDRLLVTVRAGDVEGQEVRSLLDRIDRAATAELGDADVAITGKPVVNRVIIENGTSGQVRMTALSFVVALLFLAVALRSVTSATVLIASVPATAAILMVGAMAVFDIPWNPGTVSMASVALGVGVDYGLHVYERYEELVTGAGAEPSAAMAAALRKLSRPVLGSGLTTMAGFGVLVVSRFPVVKNFGAALVLVIATSLLATFVTLPAAVLARARYTGRHDPGPRRIGPGTDAGDDRAIRIASHADGDTAGRSALRLGDLLGDAETPLAVAVSDAGDVRHEQGGEPTTVEPGPTGRTAFVATDDRVLLVVGDATDGATWHASVEYTSIRSIETHGGLRRSRVTLDTRDDGEYRVSIGGRRDLTGVAEVVRRTRDHWVRAERRLEDARSRLARVEEALADDDPAAAASAYDEAREFVAAARDVADDFDDGPHALRRRVERQEIELAETRFEGHRTRAENLCRVAESHRDAGRFEAAHDAYTSALDQYDRALEFGRAHDDLDTSRVSAARADTETAIEALSAAPLERAEDAADRARATTEPAEAVEAWATALERYRTVLELVWSDDDRFEGDSTEIRKRIEWAAANRLKAHHDRAMELEARADDLGPAAGDRRRERYEAALDHLETARDLAREFRSGDPATVAEPRDRVREKLADADETEFDLGSDTGFRWEPRAE